METLLERPKRRHRNVRMPTGKTPGPSDRDLIWFQKLAEHGSLPFSFLHDFTSDQWTCRAKAQQRCTDLYHETGEHGGPYLDREDDYSTPERCYEAIYKLNKSSQLALEETGFIVPDHDRKGTSAHQFMCSTSGASIEIAVQKHPELEWTSEMQMMADAPSHSLRFPCEITYKGDFSKRGVIPDRLFQIKYRSERPSWRTGFVECDRNGEPWTRASLEETSYRAKYLRYREINLGDRFSYKTHLNKRAGMIVLNIMTSVGHKDYVKKKLLEEFGPCRWMLFKVVPGFGKKLYVPKPMYQLLHEPWERVGYTDLDIRNPLDAAA